MPQSHGNGGIMRHQRQQSVFSFHVGPVTEREGWMGELQAKESICELEHWIDASSIEELWWLQGSLLCSNAIGKAITACSVIWPNDVDPASLIAAIHSGQMAVNLSNVALRRMNKQEDARVHTSVGKIHMTGGCILFLNIHCRAVQPLGTYESEDRDKQTSHTVTPWLSAHPFLTAVYKWITLVVKHSKCSLRKDEGEKRVEGAQKMPYLPHYYSCFFFFYPPPINYPLERSSKNELVWRASSCLTKKKKSPSQDKSIDLPWSTK